MNTGTNGYAANSHTNDDGERYCNGSEPGYCSDCGEQVDDIHNHFCADEEVCVCLSCDRKILLADAYNGPAGMSVLCDGCYRKRQAAIEREAARERELSEQQADEGE